MRKIFLVCAALALAACGETPKTSRLAGEQGDQSKETVKHVELTVADQALTKAVIEQGAALQGSLKAKFGKAWALGLTSLVAPVEGAHDEASTAYIQIKPAKEMGGSPTAPFSSRMQGILTLRFSPSSAEPPFDFNQRFLDYPLDRLASPSLVGVLGVALEHGEELATTVAEASRGEPWHAARVALVERHREDETRPRATFVTAELKVEIVEGKRGDDARSLGTVTVKRVVKYNVGGYWRVQSETAAFERRTSAQVSSSQF